MFDFFRSLFCITPMLVAWVGCFWVIREWTSRGRFSVDWRLSLVLANVLWGTLLTFIVELSSLLHSVNRPTLFILWIIVDVFLIGVAASLSRQRGALSVGNIRKACLQLFEKNWMHATEAKILAGVTLLLVFYLLGVAVSVPTTNYDSVCYHVPRVFHWIQQQSVEHFPTNNERQIQYGPWSSFVLLNFYLLSDSDRFFNCTQWFAQVFALLGLGFIARQLLLGERTADVPDEKKRTRVEAWTWLLAVTVPIGIVESITTQNDYIVAYWTICLYILLWKFFQEPGNRLYAIGAGLACGLGILTKSTIFIYAAPLIFFTAGWAIVRLKTMRSRIVFAAIFCAGVFLITTPHFSRNFEIYGSPLGSKSEFQAQRNKQVSISNTTANVIRLLALHTNTGITSVTRMLNWALEQIYWLTGRSLNDPDISFHLGRCFFQDEFRLYDCYGSGPYHLLLIVIAFGLLARKWKENPTAFIYATITVCSALLFCAYLRYQMWTRFHLAFFILLAPIAALIVVQQFKPAWATTTAVVFTFLAVFYPLKNESQPIFDKEFLSLPREDQFCFLHAKAPNEHLKLVAGAIISRPCQAVGLKMPRFEIEHPLWLALQKGGFTGRVSHVFVENDSARKGSNTADVVLTDSELLPSSLREEFPYAESFGLYVLRWKEKPPAAKAITGNPPLAHR